MLDRMFVSAERARERESVCVCVCCVRVCVCVKEQKRERERTLVCTEELVSAILIWPVRGQPPLPEAHPPKGGPGENTSAFVIPKYNRLFEVTFPLFPIDSIKRDSTIILLWWKKIRDWSEHSNKNKKKKTVVKCCRWHSKTCLKMDFICNEWS